jgi:hypothetical protein
VIELPIVEISGSRRWAVLIDADNIPSAAIDGVLAEVGRLGEATVKRVYGNFASDASASWKAVSNRHALKAVQQFAYTNAKNATDIALVIDAMDLLHTCRFDGFCLVSSDSDFTGLAVRIREEGLSVVGFGEAKTPESFRNACHRFVTIEPVRPVVCVAPVQILTVAAASAPKPAPPGQAPVKPQPKPQAVAVVAQSKPSFPYALAIQALEQSKDKTGWSHLGSFGHQMKQLEPNIDWGLYGPKKLGDFVKSRPDIFRIEERATGGPGAKEIYVRAK